MTETDAALQELAEGVLGFVYHGDRLNALCQTVDYLRAHPDLVRRLFSEDK